MNISKNFKIEIEKLNNIDYNSINQELRNITIGIPARNEENTIRKMLDSLIESIEILPKWVNYELFICLNNCTDNTEAIVDGAVEDYKKKNINLQKVHSKPGKIEAQRKVLQSRKNSEGLTFFFDADIIVDKYCISALWYSYIKNPELQISYAKVEPIFFKTPSLIEKIINLYFFYPYLRNKRFYFYGRAFGIKDWNVPDFSQSDQVSSFQQECITKRNKVNLQLERGPLVDDIYLSRYIAHNYGLNMIMEVKEAVVNFMPISNLTDYYYGSRRLWLELERLDTLFPEHAYLQKNFFKRKIKMASLKGTPLGIKVLIYLRVLADGLTKLVFLISKFLTNIKLIHTSEIWKPLATTKKHFKSFGKEKHE